jgi:hypothetical protein
LLIWIKNLTKKSWSDIQRARRDNGDDAFKQCDSEQITPEAMKRIDELFELDSDFSEIDPTWLYEFTYCFREGDPRRLWCIHSEDAFYVLWWDENHEVSGDAVKWDVDGKPCSPSCWHPNPIEY